MAIQKKHTFSYIAFLLWGTFLFMGFYLYVKYDFTVEEMIFGAKSYVLNHPVSGICLFMLLYLIRPLFFVIASPFDLFSGAVFGPVYGFIISAMSTFFSTMFTYGFGRITGGGFITLKEGKKFEKMKRRLEKDTFFTTMLMRLLMLPYDLTNYICGILKIPFFPYVGGTIIGVLPGTFVVVSAGSAFYGREIQDYQSLLENIHYENLWFASGLLVTILITSQVLKRKFKHVNI